MSGHGHVDVGARELSGNHSHGDREEEAQSFYKLKERLSGVQVFSKDQFGKRKKKAISI